MTDIKILLQRLFAASMAQADFGGELWSRGIEKLQEKYNCQIWLSGFMPVGMKECEVPEAPITIEINNKVVEL